VRRRGCAAIVLAYIHCFIEPLHETSLQSEELLGDLIGAVHEFNRLMVQGARDTKVQAPKTAEKARSALTSGDSEPIDCLDGYRLAHAGEGKSQVGNVVLASAEEFHGDSLLARRVYDHMNETPDSIVAALPSTEH
jgi:hypothetical protein